MITTEQVASLIQSGMPNAQVKVLDPHNDQTHLQAIVISDDFKGLNRVQQHRLVYKALGDAFSGPLHALQLQTLTPEEAEKLIK